jgi:hypothetical protein
MRPPSLLAACAALGLFTATTAGAGLPSPANSTIPSHIHVVGRFASQPDTTAGRFTVTVRDLANNPILGAMIVMDFSANPDVRLATDQLDGSVTLNCAQKTVHAFTDVRGQASFTILGAGTLTPTGSTVSTTRIFQDGMLLGSVPTSVYDLDAVNGMGANDLSLWLTDFGSGLNLQRGDYDGSGSLGANDLSVWLVTFGAGASSTSATPACP